MNIAKMHIGIELALQELNSNLYNTLQHEEKDYILNRVIENFIRAVALDEKNEIRSILSIEDIKRYYETINPFIRDEIIGHINYQSEGYVEGLIPSANIVGELTNLFLRNGVTYRIQTAGITDLTPFGYDLTQEAGDEFICNTTEITSIADLDIFKGEIYRIINNPDGHDFTQYGAESNEPGSEFRVNADTTITSGDIVTLKPILRKAIASLGDIELDPTELVAVDNVGYFELISSQSLVSCGNPITSGELTKDEYYVVLVNGTTDLSGYGAYNPGDNDVNLVFKCINTGTPSWAGSTRLMKIKKVGNRLIKYNDKAAFLQHSYGTVITSPVSTMINNRLRVFHDKKFSIYGIQLQHVKIPNEVDYNNSIDCNLPASIHGKLVDWAVMKIMGTINNPTYNAVKDYEVTDKSLTK